jgi:hypothetical protein
VGGQRRSKLFHGEENRLRSCNLRRGRRNQTRAG